MTVDAFIEALKGLTAVPVSIIEHLETLAPYMTDEQRAQAIKDFTKLNKDAEKSLKKVEKFVEESKGDLEKARKEYLPKMHALQEEAERAGALGVTESQMNDA